MVTRKVSIWIRYKQEGEWVMKRAQWSANRRNLVPGMAKGARFAVEEYLYYLRYQRDGKRIMEPAGRDSVAAVARATTREIELFAAERGQQAAGRSGRGDELARQVRRRRAGVPPADRGRNEALDLQRLQAGDGELPRGLPAVRLPRPSDRRFPPGVRRLDARASRPDHGPPPIRRAPHVLAKNGIEVTLAKGDRPKRRVVSKDGTDIET